MTFVCYSWQAAVLVQGFNLRTAPVLTFRHRACYAVLPVGSAGDFSGVAG
jgi:hypothetical protein